MCIALFIGHEFREINFLNILLIYTIENNQSGTLDKLPNMLDTLYFAGF